MAHTLINLANKEYTNIPAGDRIVVVKKAEAKPLAKPQFVEILVADENGSTLNTTYDLSNEKAVFALTCFLEALIPDLGNTIDANDIPSIVGKYVEVKVEHTVKPSTKKPGETVTFAKITRVYYEVEGFEDKVVNNYSAGGIE